MPDAKAQPVIIKKYANRRLYNTESSSYITLEHLATMTREGRDFKVVDARTGDEITRSVLTQIIMEEEQRGQTMLPVSFLRQLIGLYGDSMQAMVPHYLEASMDAFRRNQEQFREAMTSAFGGAKNPALAPFEAMAKQNMALFQAAADMMTGRSAKKAEPAPPADRGGEIDDLRSQMAALQAKLEELAKR